MNFSLHPSSLEKEVEKKSTLNSQYLWYKRMLARRACKLTKEAAILWNVQTNPQEETLTQWLTIGILCGNSKAVYSMSFSPTTAGENLQQTKTRSVRQGLQVFLFVFVFFAFSSSSFLSFFSSFLFLSPFFPESRLRSVETFKTRREASSAFKFTGAVIQFVCEEQAEVRE